MKQKAEIGALRPDTSLAPETDPDDWSPIGDSQVLSEELFPARRAFTLGARVVERVNTADDAHSAPSIEEMLQGNLARQRQTEGELLKPRPPRPNKRRRDYLFLVITGNALAILGFILLPANPMVLVSLLAFFVIYNLGLAWTLYGVMDRY